MPVYVAIIAACLILGLPSQCFEYIVSDTKTGLEETQKNMGDMASHPFEYGSKAWRDFDNLSKCPDKSKGPQKKYSWEELKHLDGKDNRHLCLVMNCKVYDVTNLSDWHPAGPDVLKEWVGRDATKGFQKCGIDPSLIDLAMNKFLVGYVEKDENGLCYEEPSGKFNETGPAIF